MSETGQPQKLEPCPFCGGNASPFVGRHSFNDVVIECDDCGAEGPMFDADTGDAEADKAANADNALEHWNKRAELTRLQQANAALVDREKWRDGAEIPPVDKGDQCEYIVAVFRARTGKIYSFAATYLNAFPLEYQDGCPFASGDSETCKEDCGDGCPTTGWYVLVGDDNYDAGAFQAIPLGNDDKLLAWRTVPQFEGFEALAQSAERT